MNKNIFQNTTDDLAQMPSCQVTDWLKDLNDVTKFDDRNVGHDSLFFKKKVRSDKVPRKAKGMRNKEKESESVRDQSPFTRGMGRGARSNQENDELKQVGIPQMIFTNVGSAHRLYAEERNGTDSTGGSSSVSSEGGKIVQWNPLLDQEEDQFSN